MDLNKVIRFGLRPPEPPEFIAAIEVHCGVILPKFLKDLYAIGEDAHVGPIPLASGEDLTFDFHLVREALSEHYGSTVIEEYDLLLGSHSYLKPNEIIPIGGPGNGDQICLDYRDKIIPTVVLYNHETAYGNSEPFALLAESFEKLFGIEEE